MRFKGHKDKTKSFNKVKHLLRTIKIVNNLFYALQKDLWIHVCILSHLWVYVHILHLFSLYDRILNERSTYTLTEPHIEHTHTNAHPLHPVQDLTYCLDKRIISYECTFSPHTQIKSVGAWWEETCGVLK